MAWASENLRPEKQQKMNMSRIGSHFLTVDRSRAISRFNSSVVRYMTLVCVVLRVGWKLRKAIWVLYPFSVAQFRNHHR